MNLQDSSRRLCVLRRSSRLSSHAGRRRGTAYTLVVLALPMLVGAAAMAIDLGLLTLATQYTQTTVDQSALAAAARLPDSSDATAALQGILAANNVESSSWSARVDPATDLRFYHGGQIVPGFGELDPDTSAVSVTARTPVQFHFARVLGIEQTTAVRSATAIRTSESSGSICIFALSTEDDAVNLPLSNMLINGVVHSNGGIRVTGSNALFRGIVQCNGPLVDTGSGNVYEMGHRHTEVRSYPIMYTEDDFDIDYEVNGDWVLTANEVHLSPGTYRVRGDFIVRSEIFSAINCTIIADGEIWFRGDAVGPKITPHQHDVALYSLNADIFMTANGTEADGIFFAPNGHISYRGDNQRIASAIARTVTLHGQSIHVTGVPGTGWGEQRVQLVR